MMHALSCSPPEKNDISSKLRNFAHVGGYFYGYKKGSLLIRAFRSMFINYSGVILNITPLGSGQQRVSVSAIQSS